MNIEQTPIAAANCLTGPSFLGPTFAQQPPNGFSVEPVDGGYIVSGTFPAVGYRRCVASSIPALIKLLRMWTGQPKKKKDA